MAIDMMTMGEAGADLDEEGGFHEIETYDSALSMDQTVILASMIEKEAANREDYGRVSAVFHNRLRLGMKLESDPTVTYLSGEHKLALSDADIAQQNPYNTYYVPALPAGPICNPSMDAVMAALYPDEDYVKDQYLYFCSTDPNSGALHFSRTLEEHEKRYQRMYLLTTSLKGEIYLMRQNTGQIERVMGNAYRKE